MTIIQLTGEQLSDLIQSSVRTALKESPAKQADPTEQPEKLLNVQEAAQFLSLTVPTIYSKVSRKELPVMKRSKRLYFSSKELIAYLKGGRKMSNAEIEAEAEAYLTKSRKG